MNNVHDQASTAFALVKMATQELEYAETLECRRELIAVIVRQTEILSQLFRILVDEIKN